MQINVLTDVDNIVTRSLIKLRWLLLMGFLVLAAAPALHAANRQFYLKNGDRVLFYGDSITEQRFYSTEVELFVRTRFPNLHVRFVNSAFGGDRVTGGGAGTINVRLKRDVFPFKPNIVTIMLGMNDAWYVPFKQRIFNTYTKGYEHIIKSLQKHLPGVNIVLVEPSPYDDVTHKPYFSLDPKYTGTESYNGVLIRYGRFVRQLAAKYHLMCVNFNKPLVDVLRQANHISHALATQIIPGRIHPDANGQLVMAETLLKAWNAPATVTAVQINAGDKTVAQAENTHVSGLTVTRGIVSWTQMDKALPMALMDLHGNWPQFPQVLVWPYNRLWQPGGPNWNHTWLTINGKYQPTDFWQPPQPKWNYVNPVTALVVKASHIYSALDSESLKVPGLTAPRYTLKIDGQLVGTFSSAQLATGINLARYHTPMLAQSYHVMHVIWHAEQMRFYIWHDIQLPLAGYGQPSIKKAEAKLIATLYHHLFQTIERREYVAAQPVLRHYELVPGGH
ncbi:MAG: SGNH/GDSL hydrolase family protein [Phycisphaerae bacterium]